MFPPPNCTYATRAPARATEKIPAPVLRLSEQGEAPIGASERVDGCHTATRATVQPGREVWSSTATRPPSAASSLTGPVRRSGGVDARSEERRVGKGCGSRGGREQG